MRMTMNLTINELRKKWDGILPYNDGFLLAFDAHPLSFHIGYFGEHRCFMVLDVETDSELISSKAISVNRIATGNGKEALQFVLNYDSLKDIFLKLCWDLMDSTKKSEHPTDDMLMRFKKWIILMQKQGDGILTSSTQKGIIGELLFLQSALRSYNEKEVIEAWVGPEGSDQDFIFLDKWVEIKTATIAATAIKISSLQQLERNDIGELIVYYMDRTTSRGMQTFSLPQVIEDTEKMLNNAHNKDLLECKLSMCGYDKSMSNRYQEVRYRLARKQTYLVTEEFPKMTRETVPGAVRNAVYELETSAIQKYLIQGD